jgi:putative alpha-1,2-mannosidase
MNGKALETPWFSHEDLMNGGTLELEMAEQPGPLWNQGKLSDVAMN